MGYQKRASRTGVMRQEMERYFSPIKNKCTNIFEFMLEELLYRTVENFAYLATTISARTLTMLSLRLGWLAYPYKRQRFSDSLPYRFPRSLFVTILLAL